MLSAIRHNASQCHRYYRMLVDGTDKNDDVSQDEGVCRVKGGGVQAVQSPRSKLMEDAGGGGRGG